jgi:protein SCO1
MADMRGARAFTKRTNTADRTVLAWLLAGLLGLSMAGCDRSVQGITSAGGSDATGTDMAKELSLTDHHGKPRTLADFRGKVVVVAFGYMHCPDVCSTTLADMARALKLLGNDAGKVQVLFVTLDPKRDTPALLGQYATSFHPNFLSLYGDRDATEKAARNFGVDYQEHLDGGSDDTLDHTAGSFVLDANGKLRVFFRNGIEPTKMAEDLRTILR